MKFATQSELINCKKCGKESELKYDSFDCIVSEDKCKCEIKVRFFPKELDVAFKKLEGFMHEELVSKNK